MTFIPRLTEPDTKDSWWISSTRGGRNECILINNATGSVLPNCTGYAWGRFSEILGYPCSLSRGNAGTWINYAYDGYSRGSEPQLGSVMCFAKPGEAGHVCIVEQINADGSIITSESGYHSTSRFWTKIRKKPWDYNNYIFQGFIYNPGVVGTVIKTQKELFIEYAEEAIGNTSSWIKNILGNNVTSLSASLVAACANKVGGMLNVVIPNTSNCGDIARIGFMNNLGEWLKGPAQGSEPQPEPGDIVLFRNSGYRGVNTYFADSCGIVTRVTDNIFNYTYSTSTSILQGTQSKSSKQISGYFRPDWSKLDEGKGLEDEFRTSSGLYSAQVSREDAAIREIGYISGRYPTTSTTGIKLSVVNYTGLLANLYSVFGNALLASDSYNTNSTQTVVVSTPNNGSVNNPSLNTFSMLKSYGLNDAASCGILANIQAESNFNTGAIGDNGTSFGICQWHNERGSRMKKFCGDNWATNLSGQVGFLISELSSLFPSLLSKLKSAPDSKEGAMNCAEYFVREFERPSNIKSQVEIRRNLASKYYTTIITQR